MNFKLLWQLAVRNVWRNPKRSLLTISAVVVGVGGFVSLAALARGVSSNMAHQAIVDLTGHIQLHAPHYLDDPAIENSINLSLSDITKALTVVPTIEQWSARVRVPGVIMSERESRGIVIVGIDPPREKQLSFIGDGVIEGRELADETDTGIVVGAKLLEDLETSVGRRIVLMAQSATGEIAERGFRIVGSFRTRLQTTEERFVFLGRRTAQEMLGMGEKLSEVSLLIKDSSQVSNAVSVLRARNEFLDIKSWQEIQPLAGAVLKIQNGFLFLWLIIVVITIAFGVVNTMFMAIFERVREIGLLQALGMKPKYVLHQVVLESAVLLLTGAVIGSVVGIAIAQAFQRGIDLSQFSEGLKMAGFGTKIFPEVRPTDLFLANILVVIIGIVSSIYPAAYAARLRPVEALRKT